MKISKELVSDAFIRLTETTKSRFWGLLSIFYAIDSAKELESRITYKVDIPTISYKLQSLFYFGDAPKTNITAGNFFIMLSSSWLEEIQAQLLKDGKPNILDVAIFFFRDTSFEEEVNSSTLVEMLNTSIKISNPQNIDEVFNTDFTDSNLPVESYDNIDLFSQIFTKLGTNANDRTTLVFESPFTIASHPSELTRASFTQPLYSGNNIQKLLLYTNIDIDQYYGREQKVTEGITDVQEYRAVNKIFFGPPGTGKSHKVKELLEARGISEDQQIRITFHPEYDYNGFVGGYKPIMVDDKIKYQFAPQVFTKAYIEAWQNTESQYYLIIEEINRGNCAEIFGDIFQLLDRTYDVNPDEDLLKYLKQGLGEDHRGIKNSKMSMPPNLHLWATMNTSDQSLFPMDSAFKRRWEWEYIPINYDEDEDSNPSFQYLIRVGEYEYRWISFLKAVNQKIYEITESEDKQIGNWFVKPSEDFIISLEQFYNKVLFFLWFEIYKDEDQSSGDYIFRNSSGQPISFGQAFSDKEGFTKFLLENTLGISPQPPSLDENIPIVNDEEDSEKGEE